MTFARLGLLAMSAAVAALIVAVVMPFTEPESLASISRHPVGGRVLNASAAAAQAIADLLAGVSPSETGPSLLQYYPLPTNVTPSNMRPRTGRRRADPTADLDWADPAVWRLQQENISGPYYTRDDIDRLLYWCRKNSPNGSVSGGSSGRVDPAAAAGAGGRGGREEAKDDEEAALRARFVRLAEWVTLHGGNVTSVTLDTDGDGVRGLHTTRDVAPGEVVLSVPLRLGLSVATFRAARMAAGATAHWRSVPDADLFLDALALSYEIAVHGDRSPWADHLCLLPRSYGGLPVHTSDPREAALVAQLPSLRRLAAKRRAQLALLENDLAGPTLQTLPGGRAARMRLKRKDGGDGSAAATGNGSASGAATSGRDLWSSLWHWSYAVTKTRSVTLAPEEVRYGSDRGGPPDDAMPTALRLPLAMVDWVKDFGALLPILDLANHAFDGQGANAAYQLLGDTSGSSLVACLVAQAPIPAGSPVLFDYLADTEAEQGPTCVDRWLLEYGFVPTTNDPRRDCDTFEVAAAELAKALRTTTTASGLAADSAEAEHPGSTVAPPSQNQACDASEDTAIETRLAARLRQLPAEGLPSRLEIHVRQPDPVDEGDIGSESGDTGHVRRRWEVWRWLTAALRDEIGTGVSWNGGNAGDRVGRVLKALLEARKEQLRALEARARELDETQRSAGREEAGDLRRGLVAVAAAARRAVERAVAQERRLQG